MTKKLDVAIIGYGKVGRIRRRCSDDHPNLNLIALCDLGDQSEKEIQGVYFSKDWREIVALCPDLVFVCTTNESIPEITIEALRRGINVFCEKPPGRTVVDVQRMAEAEASSPGGKLCFGFNHRYHQAVLDAKALIDKGRMGDILWMRGVYGKAGGPAYDRNWRNDPVRSGGGILIDQGIHMIDLLHFFCGTFPEVKSMVGRTYWKVPVEDNAMGIMRNELGQMAMIHSSATQWRHKFILDVCLERGYLSLDGILSSTMTYGAESLKVAHCVYDSEGYPLPNPQEAIYYYTEDRSWAKEVDYFVRCILESRPVENCNSIHALAAMEAVHRIYSQDNATFQL
ncbi:MAG: Gfo/Idh/MocA family oxidoreductase [Magnetococcales bacterium]|nr:Gfo/Idh/MocA family oxidoreductase [Magnetococcales bacterium]